MPVQLLDIVEQISTFFNAGGPVLLLIAGLTFLLWVLIFERFMYFHSRYPRDIAITRGQWGKRQDHGSWSAMAIRDKLISEAKLGLDQNLSLIKTMIVLCPLFGLLGTVTGMIDVFTVLSINGGSDVRAMAGGVSRATIPTMAGMVAALSGLFANIYLTRKATKERALLEEHLTMDNPITP